MHKFILSLIITRHCCKTLWIEAKALLGTSSKSYTMRRTIARTCRAFVPSVTTSSVSRLTMMLFFAAIGTQITSIAPRYKNTLNASFWRVDSSGRKRPEIIRRRVETLTMFARNTRHWHLLRTCSRTIFSLLSRQRWYSNFRPWSSQIALAITAGNAFESVCEICRLNYYRDSDEVIISQISFTL